jgi:O-antigen ligase
VVKFLERISEYLFYLFFFSLIFSNTFSEGIAIILILLWIFKWIQTRSFSRNPLDLPVVLYLLIRMVTCFTSVDMLVSLKELRSGIFFSLIYFALTNLTTRERREILINRYIALIVYSGALSSLYAVSSVVIHQFTVKAQSTAGGVTRFAEFSMISFCLSFVLARKREVFPKRFIAFIVLGLLSTGLLFSQERAQWLGIIPTVFVYGIMRERWGLGFIVILQGILSFFLRTIRERAKTLVHPFVHSTGRLEIWKGARSILLKRPLFGFGPRTYPIVSPVLKDRGTWHSDYLQVFMDSGIFALASYLYLSFMLFKRCIVTIRRGRTKDLGYALFFTFVGMYIVSFFSGHTQEPVITPLFFSLIGLLSILGNKKTGITQKSS